MKSSASLREATINTIKSKIQYNELTPNEIITEAKLCEEIGISRTPVREALIQLVADGILKKVPNKGYTVERFDSKSKMNLFCVYSTLDALAATLAVDYMTEAELLKMCECVDKIEIALKYHNYSDYYKLQDQFHKVYINKCDNPMLISMLEDLSSSPVNRSYIDGNGNTEKLYDVLHEANNEHREIIELFRKKDKAALELFLRTNHWTTKYPDLI